ncbi:uracil-DNA glycosylase [candidate division Kazan bacterium]|uniref:Type-4 uracil-DNA glycosylase n=1 Tax=candidate division Kazan bacterium TaxID=2202143 RepID=A0A420ZDG3_UNCK3|nr:MAG: uracil-DNA glycosylase [candidate division Kazan bacterium]
MDRQAEFEKLVQDIKEHTCSLRAGCIQAVPGDGNINSPVMFIGEGPGRVEDEQGKPFVGPAGKLWEEAIGNLGWKREDVYITNVIKCRPPNNRDPLASEVEEHKPFLERELEIIKPKLIVLLGRHAMQWFLPGEKISAIRGTAKRRGGRIYFVVYHPAAALYDPKLKSVLMADFKKIPILLKKIDKLPPIEETKKEIQAILF